MIRRIDSTPRRRTARLLAASMGLALAMTTMSIAQESVDEPANAATTSLTSAPNIVALANTLALADHASSSRVVISENSDSAIHLASNVASRAGLPLLVAGNGVSVGDLANSVSALSATSAILVSSTANWFSAFFQAELGNLGVATSHYHQGTDLFERWSGASYDPLHTEYVLARTDDGPAVAQATSYAASRGLPLVLWEETTSASALNAFFANVVTATLYFFGNRDVVPTSEMAQSQIDDANVIGVEDPQQSYTWLAGHSQIAGAVSNRVVAAPSSSLGVLGIAGAHARIENGLLAPAGAPGSLNVDSRAHEYLTLWGTETGSVELIGVGLNSADLTTVIEPTLSSRDAAPSFRVTDIVKNVSGYEVSFTSVGGATTYAMYDWQGLPIATSSTNSITVSTEQSGYLLTAESSAGELARLDVRVNEYADSAQRASVIVGATGDGSNHLVFLSDLDVPRLITRAITDPFTEFPTEPITTPVAITCEPTYTDASADATKEYKYFVTEMTNVAATACDPLAPALIATAENLQTGGIPLPATQMPWFSKARSVTPKAASKTRMDQLIVGSEGHGSQPREMGTQAAGDGWLPLDVLWTAYIPEARIPFPGYSGDLAKPIMAFGGDNHGTDQPNESARFKQRLQFTFGSSHNVTYTESMGVSHKYKCSLTGSCTLLQSATAPLSELNWSKISSTNTTGVAQVWASASLPLVPNSPSIDTNWHMKVAPGNSRAVGYHNNMPKHEIYFGNPNSHFYKLYSSPYASWMQLPCLFVPQGVPLTKCTSVFNVQL